MRAGEMSQSHMKKEKKKLSKSWMCTKNIFMAAGCVLWVVAQTGHSCSARGGRMEQLTSNI